MKWHTARTVQKGKQLSNEEAVRKRLLEISQQKKSAYHKALGEGRLIVLYHETKRPPCFSIVEVSDYQPKTGTRCAECGDLEFLILNDYLCTECRIKMNEKGEA